MVYVLAGLGILLIGWGAALLVTGEFVATLDIAAGLVSSGVGVIGLAAIVRSLDRVADRLPHAEEMDDVEDGVGEMEPAAAFDIPAALVEPVPSSIPPAPIAAAPAPSPATIPAQVSAEEPAPKRAPPETAPPQTSETRVLVREGEISGRLYRFYSDGTIEAEGPSGIQRYGSIDEARAEILRTRGQPVAPPASTGADTAAARTAASPPVPPPASTKPEPAPVPPVVSRPEREDDEPPPPRQPVRPVTWESYLAAGRAPQKSEDEANKKSADEISKDERSSADESPRKPPRGTSELD